MSTDTCVIDVEDWQGADVCTIGDVGFGLLGSEIASSGTAGPGYAYNDLALPADASKEICGQITTWPAFGTLQAFEDTSFIYTRTGDGADSFAYQLYVDGAAVGSPQTVTLNVGVASATINLVGATTTQSATSGTGVATVTPPAAGVVNLVGASTTQGATSSTGAAGVVHTPKTINLVGSNSTQGAVSGTGAAQVIPSEGQNMSFTASAARTVSIGAGSKPFTAGELWNMSDPKKPRAPKDPDGTTDFSFNWGPWLQDVTDTIATHTILTTEGLVDQGSQTNGNIVTVFLSAGNSNKRAEVTCRISTNSTPPRIEDRTIFLDIESR